jgi:nucleoside 2-deoxyribosyltransferase
VFAILNGLDAGTIFEVGYAVKKGIPVVCLAQNVGAENLKMVEGTSCEVVDDFVSALYRTVWRLPKA